MHPYFSVMDERWFHRAFVYTGSVTDREKNLDFRYRYEQVKGDDGDALKASTYSDLCYELAQDVEEETFPWTDEGVEELKAEGIISGGMIPKVECCTNAIRAGVRKVFIIDGRVPHALLIETLTDEGAGTMFKKQIEGNYVPKS